ncbi:MAG: O-antigen ligase family protein [bacterium]|nr:O-antigen ligase family protein [bacterium]
MPKIGLSLTNLLHTLVLIFIFTLPFQTRYIFNEGENQFTTLGLYGFDIIFIILLAVFIFWWYRQKETKLNWSVISICFALVVFTGISAYWSVDREISFHFWIRFIEALLAAAIISASKIPIKKLLYVLLLNGLVQSIFILWQNASQHVYASKWLGMSEQIGELSGTAVVVTDTGRFLRAFGTLPHPNIAGGLILISLVSAIIIWQYSKENIERYALLLVVSICSFGLLLTFSRTAVLVWLAILAITVFLHYKQQSLLVASLLSISVAMIIYLPQVQSRVLGQQFVETYSMDQRGDQFAEAGAVLKKRWPQGVGIGAYTVALKNEEPQPIHNIYLLVASELGVIAALVFFYWNGWMLFKVNKKSRYSQGITLMLGAILLAGIMDHYFWTLPSMFMLWMIIIGLQLRESKLT